MCGLNVYTPVLPPGPVACPEILILSYPTDVRELTNNCDAWEEVTIEDDDNAPIFYSKPEAVSANS